jgi:hypothetical protein
MDLMLTSFGLRDANPSLRRSPFFGMPPTAFAITQRCLEPDYAALLLSERIIIDEESYERLTHRRHWSYNVVADTMRALQSEGFLRLENYSHLLAPHENAIAAAVEQDVREPAQWRRALSVSVERWSSFVELTRLEAPLLYASDGPSVSVRDSLRWVSGYLSHVIEGPDAYLHSRVPFTEEIDTILREYLTYVESNIRLAQELRTPLYDWYDYQPFYEQKLTGLRRSKNTELQKVQQLFDVSFPEFSIASSRQLIRILKDKRISQLRELISTAARGDVTFDREFAVRVLLEVLSSEEAIGRYRSIISYGLLPLGLIPTIGTPLQKAAEEAVSWPYERKRREHLSWFYLLSEARNVPRN